MGSLSGGDFVWGEYGVGARMYKCDGVSMLFWKGKTDLHGTTIARQDGSFTILGTSMQISRYLTQKVTRYHKSSDMQGSIGDADQLLNCMENKKLEKYFAVIYSNICNTWL